MNNIDYIKIRYCSGMEGSIVKVKLSCTDEGTYLLKYDIENRKEKSSGHREISKADSERINEIITKKKIPIITMGMMGMDGHSVEVTFVSSGNEVTYSWWVSPNPGWKPLKDFLRVVSKYLPYDL